VTGPYSGKIRDAHEGHEKMRPASKTARGFAEGSGRHSMSERGPLVGRGYDAGDQRLGDIEIYYFSAGGSLLDGLFFGEHRLDQRRLEPFRRGRLSTLLGHSGFTPGAALPAPERSLR
jgi:hypothetical protein